jgi:hypothetical protein
MFAFNYKMYILCLDAKSWSKLKSGFVIDVKGLYGPRTMNWDMSLVIRPTLYFWSINVGPERMMIVN